MADPDYYAVLQVEASAPPEVIDAAYRALARTSHPDVSAAADASERMRALNEAYRILHDPDARAAYDARRARRAAPASTPGGAPPVRASERPIDLFSAAVADVWRRRPRRAAAARRQGEAAAPGPSRRRAVVPLLALGAGALAGALGAPLLLTSGEARDLRAYWGIAARARAAVEDARAQLTATPGATGALGYPIALGNNAYGSLVTQLVAELEGAASRLRAATRVPGAAEAYHFLQLEDWREEREIRTAQRDAVQGRKPDLWAQTAERESAWRVSATHLKCEAAAWALAARAAG